MQFLPSEWSQYGVDVNNSGYEDPYNPADAIFAAARYLKQAGGDTDIRAAVLAYNHSQAYVESVMLRARLLGGTPPELLGAITGLTEARFPVYAASHYSDGFPTTEGPSPHTVPATTIYTQAGAPVIAAQDGRISQIDPTGPFGPSISLVDAYGNTYTYAGLGTLASLYPVLESAEAGAPRAAGLSSIGMDSGPSSAAASGATRDLQGRLGERLPAPIARRGAGDRRHRARSRRLRSRTSHRLSDPPRRYRRAADRPEADPRRLGQAAKLLRRESHGPHAIRQAHAKPRTGAAGVKDAARAAGPARSRDPPAALRAASDRRRPGRQARARGARVPLRFGFEPDRLRPQLRAGIHSQERLAVARCDRPGARPLGDRRDSCPRAGRAECSGACRRAQARGTTGRHEASCGSQARCVSARST